MLTQVDCQRMIRNRHQEYIQYVPLILKSIGCTKLGDIYPDKINNFLSHALKYFNQKKISLLVLSEICEDILNKIPMTEWYNYEEIILILQIADLGWYLEQGKTNVAVVSKTLQEISKFSKCTISLD